jgi:hypothetical protein
MMGWQVCGSFSTAQYHGALGRGRLGQPFDLGEQLPPPRAPRSYATGPMTYCLQPSYCNAPMLQCLINLITLHLIKCIQCAYLYPHPQILVFGWIATPLVSYNLEGTNHQKNNWGRVNVKKSFCSLRSQLSVPRPNLNRG